MTKAMEAMEARSVDAIPTGEQWQYEPKWDGFRCLLVRNSDKVDLFSKSGQNLDRYFPELVDGALSLPEKNFALDGEIVVPLNGQFSFDDLLQRIHPAESRVKKLATATRLYFLRLICWRWAEATCQNNLWPKDDRFLKNLLLAHSRNRDSYAFRRSA